MSTTFARLLADQRRNAALIGPGAGVGGETRDTRWRSLAPASAAVLDADALTVFADDPQTALRRDPRAGGADPARGRVRAAVRRATAASSDARARRRGRAARWSLLKGADTVIAAPDGRAAINDNAPPDLATAGSGDVLAGMVLGLLAQGWSRSAPQRRRCGCTATPAGAFGAGPGRRGPDRQAGPGLAQIGAEARASCA